MSVDSMQEEHMPPRPDRSPSGARASATAAPADRHAETDAQRHLHDLLDTRPAAAAQRRMTLEMNASPSVARLNATAVRLNSAARPPLQSAQRQSGGVVQAMMEDDQEADADHDAQAGGAGAAQDQQQQPQAGENAGIAGAGAEGAQQQVQAAGNVQMGGGEVQAADGQEGDEDEDAPAFTFEDLVFASVDPDAEDAAERSLYFGSGLRIRLVHDDGPHVSETRKERYSFLMNQQDNRYYDETDYEEIVMSGEPAGVIRQNLRRILKEAEPDDLGKLFEVEPGHLGDPQHIRRYHASRGSPSSQTGIHDQQHLARIVAIAREADQVLLPMEDVWRDARNHYKRAARRYRLAQEDYGEAKDGYDRAVNGLRDARNARAQLTRNAQADADDVEQADRLVARAERRLDRDEDPYHEAREDRERCHAERGQLEGVYRQRKQAWQQRVDQYNQRIQAAFAPPALQAGALDDVD